MPGGPTTIVYPYYQAGGSGDTGDVYAVRSIDNGATWSAPIAISTAPHEQWFSQAVSTGHGDLAIWYYSREHTTDGNNYEIFLRQSHDGGATWTGARRLSDVLIDEPAQNDPNINPFFAGDYNVTTSDFNGSGPSNRLADHLDRRPEQVHGAGRELRLHGDDRDDRVPQVPTSGPTATIARPLSLCRSRSRSTAPPTRP